MIPTKHDLKEKEFSLKHEQCWRWETTSGYLEPTSVASGNDGNSWKTVWFDLKATQEQCFLKRLRILWNLRNSGKKVSSKSNGKN